MTITAAFISITVGLMLPVCIAAVHGSLQDYSKRRRSTPGFPVIVPPEETTR